MDIRNGNNNNSIIFNSSSSSHNFNSIIKHVDTGSSKGIHSDGGLPRFKVALLGEAGIGKTSLFLRVRDNAFREGSAPSIGVDSCSFSIKTNNREVRMCLWDTAGVERFRTLTRNFYRNAHAVLLSFSVNNPSTLYYLTKWEEDTSRYAPDALRFLVGCKNDLDQLVTKECIENFAKTHGCEYAFITSAKTGQGIPEALATIANRLIAVHSRDRSALENSWLEENVNVNQGLSQTHKGSCC